MIKPILLLGNPKLYEVSTEVSQDELPALLSSVTDLHDTLMDFRKTYGAGRAIAAPQIGVQKRLIYMNIDRPVAMFNPVLTFVDDVLMEVLDDCMSFPGLYVRVLRHQHCKIQYRDQDWKMCEMFLEGDLSELIQHEYDHLDGILAVQRAIDNRSLTMIKES